MSMTSVEHVIETAMIPVASVMSCFVLSLG
jgi:hypothetical protein